jgi:hypothetical protein
MIRTIQKKTCNETILAALQNSRQNLSDDAIQHICGFLKSGLHEDGGFVNRGGVPDPYYSVFGYSLSFVLGLELPVQKQWLFLQSWAKNDEIDLVHAISLLQCSLLISAIEMKQKAGSSGKALSSFGFFEKIAREKLIRKVKKEGMDWLDIVASYRSQDGGFNHNRKNAEKGSVYANFLVWCLYQDLELDDLSLDEVLKGLKELQLSDGSFANENGASTGVTSASSAALIMNLADGSQNCSATINWLKNRWIAPGGFVVAEELPIADLLSTATALLALDHAGVSMIPYAEKCSEFVNMHWDNSGGFFGSIADMHCDCEYTYYALLALGLIL